jgi:hypothetical protein
MGCGAVLRLRTVHCTTRVRPTPGDPGERGLPHGLGAAGQARRRLIRGPARAGRIDHPVKFGCKAQVADNDGGVVLEWYTVEYGAAPTTLATRPCLRAGRTPRPSGLPGAHRRPRLRPGRRRARPGCPDRGDSPPDRENGRGFRTPVKWRPGC